MRFLTALPPEATNDEDKDKWADAGDPVVPVFPAPPQDMFLSTVSFLRASAAEVVDRDDLDPDEIAASLKKEYPGLPSDLHDNYVVATARIAKALPIGTKVQVVVDPDSARIREAGSDTFHTLWHEQPLTPRN